MGSKINILPLTVAILVLAAITQARSGPLQDKKPTSANDSLPGIIRSLNDTASTKKGAFKRFLYSSLYVDQRNDSIKKSEVVDESRLYSPYNGRSINSITIRRHNVFDEEDPAFWERWANKVNTLTTETTVSRDLLFQEGDKVDADLIVKNLYQLRGRNYIASAEIDIVDSQSDTTRVDVIVTTHDRWTIGVDMDVNYSGHSYVNIFDENILGTGSRLSIYSNFKIKEKSYGGNVFLLESHNMFNTFINSDIGVGKDFDYSYLNMNVFRNFILPTDYGGGVKLAKQTIPYNLIQYDDSTYRVEVQGYDLWLGRSQRVEKLDGSLFLTGRYFNWAFKERPDVSYRLNPAFHDRRGFLSSVGLYKENYYTSNLIYGYGIKEYLPAGFKVEGTFGYTDGEFWDSWYLGGQYKIGRLFKSGYYMMGAVGIGSNINTDEGQWQQGTVNVHLLGFSKIWKAGRYGVRQFVTVRYTQGWNRLEGSDEIVIFTADDQPRGFTEYVAGVNRAVMNLETVVFTPLSPGGFRTVLFGYADFGFIGNNPTVFTNDFYTTIGIGARFKNEHLIFNAIQLRLGVAFGKNGYIKSSMFQFGGQNAMNYVNYMPSRPQHIEYD